VEGYQHRISAKRTSSNECKDGKTEEFTLSQSPSSSIFMGSKKEKGICLIKLP
jgi:hypothetical protein